MGRGSNNGPGRRDVSGVGVTELREFPLPDSREASRFWGEAKTDRDRLVPPPDNVRGPRF